MPRPRYKGVLDFANREIKQRFLSFVGKLDGCYEIEIQPKRSTRSLKQNAWYWSCIVQPFHEFLKEQDYEVTADDAHEFLRNRFIGNRSIRHPDTNKLLCEHRISTTELTTEQFGEYCEKCRDLLAQYCNIVVPDPDPVHAIA